MNHRPRRPGARTLGTPAALTARPALIASLLFSVSCADRYPNSVFTRFTEFNRDIDYLFSILIWLGTLVFVFVEAILLYTLVRFKRRRGAAEPKQVHGNTTLEILWTIIPAVVLVFIAVPTVRTIFRTQAKARQGALEVTVIGHQWWWEFRYPDFTTRRPDGRVDTLVTANELYLPLGRTVNFTLRTTDVAHSFWIPQLSGKRDLLPNHTNYIWFTPDSVQPNAWNGFCAEYCGASHANMRFRAFTVSAADFEAWAQHQLTPAVFDAGPPMPQPGGPAVPPLPPGRPQTGANTPINAPAAPESTRGAATIQGPPTAGRGAPRSPLGTASAAGGGGAGQQPTTPGLQFMGFAREALPEHAVPRTPLPRGLAFQDNLAGDAARGGQLFASGMGGCIGCHAVRGVPTALGVIGPNLTHLGGRTTIGAGYYPNEPRYLARWIKNARAMKPGVVMPALGRNEYDPVTKQRLTAGLDDQQIADLVAYLLSLK
ncbi:MAG: cytochrome c oxidase subunit II [Gemmatimonadaceae bacterium]